MRYWKKSSESEVTDVEKFPSAEHFASWLGLCPDNRVTGGGYSRESFLPAPLLPHDDAIYHTSYLRL